MNAGRTIGSAVLIAAGVSAVVAAAMVRWAPDTGPRIGSVRLTELTAEFMAGAVRDAASAEETAEAARRWAVGLETALAVVAARRGIVLAVRRGGVGGRRRPYGGSAVDADAPGRACRPGLACRPERVRGARSFGTGIPAMSVSMRAPRNRRVLIGFVALAAAWLLAASRIHVNASWSDDAWGYFVVPIGTPNLGDRVVFEPPGTVGASAPYLKTVWGLPGSWIAVDRHRDVWVDDVRLGRAKPVARDGRVLAAAVPGVIPPDHYYLHADHVDSHDSRYAEIGPVPRDRILGRAFALPDLPWLGLEGPLVGPDPGGPESVGLEIHP